jgi:hypothetical protein
VLFHIPALPTPALILIQGQNGMAKYIQIGSFLPPGGFPLLIYSTAIVSLFPLSVNEY